MYTLLMDTATERAVIALFEGVTAVAVEELPAGLRNSQALLPKLEELFERYGLEAAKLTRIVVGIGPGSYTGIRVGVAAAQALAYAGGVPLVGVPTLYGFVPDCEGAFAALIDARIGGVYFLAGKRRGDTITYFSEPALVPLQEVPERLSYIPTLVAPAAAELQAKLPGSFNWIERGPDAGAMLRQAIARHESGQFSTNGQVEILYLRKSQAEIEREQC